MKDKLKFIVGAVCLALASLILVSPFVSGAFPSTDIWGAWKFDNSLAANEGGWTWINKSANYATGKDNQGMRFVTAGNYLNTTNNTQPAGYFTVNVWFNTSTPSFASIVGKFIVTGNTRSFQILTIDNMYAQYSTNGADTVVMDCGAGYAITANVIYMATFLYNSTGVYLFRNGVMCHGDAGGVINPNTASWLLGQYYADSSALNGIIDEFTIWNRGLTTAEISDLYNGGAGSFYSAAPPPPFYSSVSLNNPSNGNRTVNYTRQINFTFTPIFNQTIINCSLYTNESGTFVERANSSGIVNNTINSLVPTYNTTDIEGNITWNIRCRGASSDVFATANRTVQIDRTAPVITINYPSSQVWSMNKTNFTINYTVSEALSNLYRGNLTLYYRNGTLVKNLLYYNDLNQTSLSEARTFSWDNLTFTDYYVEVCFSDDEAASPVKESYSVKKAGLFGIKKEELIFQDEETGTDVSGTLEIITKKDNKKYSVDRSSLDVVAYKTKDNKHIVYGGEYTAAALPDKNARFRYVYHSNNGIPLKIVDPSIGLFHADTGMKSVFWQHRSLLEKGWKIETYLEGPDVVVEFWMDSYKDLIDFDPLSGGINYNCVNSSLYTKSYTLNISAVDYVSNTTIMNFTVRISGNYNDTQNTTTGNIIFPLTSGNYYINVSSPDYVPVQQVFAINESDMNKTVYLFENNSVLVYIRDEDGGASITENVTCRVTSTYGESVDYTTSGQYFISQLTPADYSFRFSSASYAERAYNLTVSEESSQILTAYLSKDTENVIFTVIDIDTGAPLENALVTMYRSINSSWSAVESKFTDVTGRAQLSYSPSVKYKFLFIMASYEIKLFYLDPVLFSSYDVLMTKIIVYNTSQDYSQINLWYTPDEYIYNNLTQFDWFIQSPGGELLSYGFNITYPGGSYADQSNNAIGGQFNYSFKITDSTSDTVTVRYFYNTSIAGRRDFKDIYHIEQYYNDTYMSNNNKTYGMGLFERVLITIILTVLIAGIFTFVGVPVVGLVLGLGAMGYFSYIGFVPIWSILPSMLVGVIVAMSRSD